MTSPTPRSAELSAQSPWPGLRPFSEADQAFFFGRTREITELLGLTQRAPVVVLYGRSGLGKTSLLQAGLFPALKRLTYFPVRLRLDHGDDAAPLARQILAALAAELTLQQIAAPAPGESETLWEYFHRRDLDFWGRGNRLLTPVIVLDQFEEAFTLGQRTDAARARVTAFLEELEGWIEHRPPERVRQRLDEQPDEALRYDLRRQSAKLVVSLREDFLPPLDTWRARVPSLVANRFRLEQLTGAQALEVVDGAGHDLVAPDVARAIVDFVSSSRQVGPPMALEARPVEPALLSVVCDELNRSRLERGQPAITADLLKDASRDIIRGFYERAFEGIDPACRDWVEDELLTSSGYRDQAALDDALNAGLPAADLDRLIDRRVLHREDRGGMPWLELTHDLLAAPADESRKGRLERQRREEAAKREAEIAQRLRRTTQLAAVFGVLLVAAAGALIFGYRMWRNATLAQSTANHALQLATEAGKQADAQAARAGKAAQDAQRSADQATQSFGTALDMADRLGQSLMDYVRSDMRVPTPTVLEIVRNASESFRQLAARSQSDQSNGVVERQARFLATSAEALFQVGHLGEGLAQAQQAVGALGETAAPDEAPARRAARADALYARGFGLSLTGKMVESRRDLAAAAALAQALSGSAWTPDLVRVNVLAELALADLDLRGLSSPAAAARYQRVLTFVSAHPGARDDLESGGWRVRALQGLGDCQVTEAAAEAQYGKASQALDQLMSSDPHNLRWLRLSAELAFNRGWTANRQHRGWAAVQFYNQAEAANDDLRTHDPENLEWQLNDARTQRGLGERARLRDPDSSDKPALMKGEAAVARLLKAEPAWRAARYLHGAILWDLADAESRGSQWDAAASLMQQARTEFQANVQRSPGDLKSVLAAAQSLSGEASALYSGHMDDEAVSLARQAVAALAPATRASAVDNTVLNNQAYFLRQQGWALDQKGSFTESAAALQEAVRILTALVARDHRAWDEDDLSRALKELGDTFDDAHDPAKAADAYDRAASASAMALAAEPHDVRWIDQMARVRLRQIDAMIRQPDAAPVVSRIDQTGTLVWNGLLDEPSNASLQQDLTGLLTRAGDLKDSLDRAGLPTTQAAALTQALDRFVADRQLSNLVAWGPPPVVSGPWRNLTDADFRSARQIVLSTYDDLDMSRVFAARSLSLDFRPNRAPLVEVGVITQSGAPGIVTLLCRKASPDGSCTAPTDTGSMLAASSDAKVSTSKLPSESAAFVVLRGRSDPILDLNSVTPPVLDTADQASAYLRFFTRMIQGDEGSFDVVENPGDLTWLAGVTADLKTKVNRLLVPLRPALAEVPKKQKDVQVGTERAWRADCTLVYAGTLFTAQLILHLDGGVEMDNDKPALTDDLDVRINYFANGVRVEGVVDDARRLRLAEAHQALDRDPEDLDALRKVVTLAKGMHEWKDAATTEARLVQVMIKNVPAKDARQAALDSYKDDLESEYVRLSWYQELAGDFDGALASTEAGLKVNAGPSHALIVNNAHALLFTGHVSQAEAIYREHIGQEMYAGYSWVDGVFDDFRDLEAAGHTHPDMARIRQFLKPTGR